MPQAAIVSARLQQLEATAPAPHDLAAFDVLKQRSSDIAQQMCIIDGELFRSIPVMEFLCRSFLKVLLRDHDTR